MEFVLTQNETNLYFKALNLMKSANIMNKTEELCTYNDLDLLITKLNLSQRFVKPESIKTYSLLGDEAKNIFEKILKQIRNKIIIENENSKTSDQNKTTQEADMKNQQLQWLKAVVHLQLGRILWRTENLKEGEKELTKCWLIIEKDDKEGVTMQVKQDVLNECGMLSFEQDNFKKSVMYFEEAKNLYENLKDNSSAWCVDDFFRTEAYDSQFKNEQKQKFAVTQNFIETLYNLTLRNMKRKNVLEAILGILKILSFQLENHSYNALDWSNLVIKLSNFCICNKFGQISRHCLTAAETVMKLEGECPSNLFVQLSKKVSKKKKEELERVSKMWAKLYLHWAKYCTMLLSVDPLVSIESSLDDFVFPLDVTESESQVKATYAVSFKEAKNIFRNGLSWLERSKEFFNVQAFSSEYVELVLLNGDLFTYLSIHESDKSSKCKMLKKGIEIQTEILNQLKQREKPYLHASISFHLGGAFYMLANNKFEFIQTQTSISTSTDLDEMVVIAYKSISFLKDFISYHRFENKLSEISNLKNLFVKAHYMMAGMYTKLFTLEPKKLFELIEAVTTYKYVVEYYHHFTPTSAEHIKMMMESNDSYAKVNESLNESLAKQKSNPIDNNAFYLDLLGKM